MAVGVTDGGQIPDGRTRVSRPVDEPPFPARQRAQPIHFLPTRAGHAQVGGRDERMVDLAPLGEDDDEGTHFITHPRPFSQKTQTHVLPSVYGPTITARHLDFSLTVTHTHHA